MILLRSLIFRFPMKYLPPLEGRGKLFFFRLLLISPFSLPPSLLLPSPLFNFVTPAEPCQRWLVPRLLFIGSELLRLPQVGHRPFSSCSNFCGTCFLSVGYTTRLYCFCFYETSLLFKAYCHKRGGWRVVGGCGKQEDFLAITTVQIYI